MKGIELQILWWDKPEVELNNLGIRPELNEKETRPFTFYSIDCIAPYNEDDKEFCTIVSGGAEYIATESYKNIKNILGNQ